MFLAAIVLLVILEQECLPKLIEVFFLMVTLEIFEVVWNGEGEVFLSNEC